MRRYLDFLTPIGLLIIVLPLVVEKATKTVPGKMEYYWLAGALFILAHLLLRSPDIARALDLRPPGSRQLKYGGNAFVFVLIIVGILACVNALAFKHSTSWDLTKSKRHSLSDQTKKIIGDLKEDITITYYQRGDLDLGRERLELYKKISPKLKTQFVDPFVDPIKARNQEVRPPLPALVVERGTRREQIHSDSEQEITNAILKVTRDTKKTVCFADGEGERDLDDMQGPEGFAVAKDGLSKSQYEIQKVVLLREPKIPETCSVFVVAGPQKDLAPPAIDSIRNYVKGGGQALILVEPEMQSPFPNLTGLLKEWNIEAGHNLILDDSLLRVGNQIVQTGGLTPVVNQYPYHEITKEFRLATVFHTARSMKAGTASIEGVVTQNLAETSPESWAETNLKTSPAEKDGADTPGPVPLGAVATIKKPTPEPPPGAEKPAEEKKEPEGRVVAFGDADFASNQMTQIGEGNLDFFLNTVSWLSQDADLISIRPKDPENHRLVLTQGQNYLILATTLGLLPGLAIVGGIVSWLSRRG